MNFTESTELLASDQSSFNYELGTPEVDIPSIHYARTVTVLLIHAVIYISLHCCYYDAVLHLVRLDIFIFITFVHSVLFIFVTLNCTYVTCWIANLREQGFYRFPKRIDTWCSLLFNWFVATTVILSVLIAFLSSKASGRNGDGTLFGYTTIIWLRAYLSLETFVVVLLQMVIFFHVICYFRQSSYPDAIEGLREEARQFYAAMMSDGRSRELLGVHAINSDPVVENNAHNRKHLVDGEDVNYGAVLQRMCDSAVLQEKSHDFLMCIIHYLRHRELVLNLKLCRFRQRVQELQQSYT